MCPPIMLVKQDVRYWYPSAKGPPLPTGTGSPPALGRDVLHKCPSLSIGLLLATFIEMQQYHYYIND